MYLSRRLDDENPEWYNAGDEQNTVEFAIARIPEVMKAKKDDETLAGMAPMTEDLGDARFVMVLGGADPSIYRDPSFFSRRLRA